MRILVLESPRLRMYQPVTDDVAHWHAWLTDPEVAAHVGGVRSPEHIERTFAFVMSNWAEWDFGTLILVEKLSLQIVGLCGINRVELDGRLEHDLGYLISKSRWSEGLATEAARAVVGHARGALSLKRITAWPDPRNAPSVRVVEKLGFTRERSISPTYLDQSLTQMSLYVWSPPGGGE